MSKLHGVANTLYIPLTARIKISKRFPDFFYDEAALSLEKEIPDDSVEKGSGEYYYMASVCRYKVMDGMLRDFINSNDRCNVIHLGAGLETAYYRIKPEKAVFYEMDLPDVIEIRRRVLPDQENDISIAGDLFDLSWADDIDKSLPTIMIASGVLQYFDQEKVQSFIANVRKVFSNAEIVFDAMNSKAIRYANKYVAKTGNKDAAIMNFYVDTPEEFAKECGITLIERQKFFTEARKTLKRELTLYTRIAMKVVDDGSRTGYILHYKL